MEQNCVFCKIVKGEMKSAIIWEDDEFLAILDIKPNTKGTTLVLTKQHYDSDIFEMPNKMYQRFLLATKKVVKILEKGLNVKRVALVVEGMEINHAHIKLYPLHNLRDKFEETIAKEKVFFNRYKGYISTLEGPEIDIAELKKIAEKIKKNIKIIYG